MFHLPHNAVIPEEVIFIINLIDTNEEYYLYDDLKAMVFEEEIRQGVFPNFHSGMYKKYMQDYRLNILYEKIKTKQLSYNDIKKEIYTDKKNINGVWNEIVRDYFEFMAFCGLLPSYYKGSNNDIEKRYYVGNTLKLYKSGELSYEDILFKMKHRNASKDFSSFTQQYDIRNRPFVVALKILNKFKKAGYNSIDCNTISYYVRTIKDEDEINNINVRPIDKKDFSEREYKEIGRGTTFLRQHLTRGLKLKDLATSTKSPCVIDLSNFDINKYNFKDKAIFIGDIFETPNKNFEITPTILKYISNPNLIEDIELKNDLKNLGLINNNSALCDYNIDTDLLSRDLVELFLNDSLFTKTQIEKPTRVELTPEYSRGKDIACGSDGSAYEKFLYEILKNKFGNNSVKWFGSNTIAQRLSDITCDIKIKGIDGIDTIIKVIVESKAGSAIKAFDERKEIDNISNTLSKEFNNSYGGIWYIIVNSDKIPSISEHGGFRRSPNQKSFKDKLISIHSSILSQMWKPTLVTAFSYDEFMKFLYAINYENKCITRMQTPNFWMWSNKFIQDSYVSIIV